jgi:gluconate 2-dehydrogenase gamma chain
MQDEQEAPGVSRRSVVVAAASLVPVSAIAPAAWAAEPGFSAVQLKTIEAFVDRLIPSDEHGPGAVECGVVTYFDRSFASVLAGDKPRILDGLAGVDSLARTMHGAGFAELSSDQKDGVLAAVEGDEGSRTFFYRMRQLALEGMFSDPYYGGNRGFAGWDLIRYPGPRMAVSVDDQRLREPIKPMRVSARGAGRRD